MFGVTKITLLITCGIFLSSCSTIGKKSPDQLVFDASINKDNKAVIEAIQSGAYTKPEIEAIAEIGAILK